MWHFGIVEESSVPKCRRDSSRESALGAEPGNRAEFLRREWQQKPMLRGRRRGKGGAQGDGVNGLDQENKYPICNGSCTACPR